jgi:uncharacterized membrane protein YfcA
MKKMNTETFLILIVIGLITGALSGMLGIGGGLIMIPTLVLFLGMNQHQAIGTSLAVMLPPIGLFAAYNFYKAGHVNITYAIVLAVAFMIGSYLTSKIAVSIPENTIKKIFSVFLIIIAIKMFFTK